MQRTGEAVEEGAPSQSQTETLDTGVVINRTQELKNGTARLGDSDANLLPSLGLPVFSIRLAMKLSTATKHFQSEYHGPSRSRWNRVYYHPWRNDQRWEVVRPQARKCLNVFGDLVLLPFISVLRCFLPRGLLSG